MAGSNTKTVKAVTPPVKQPKISKDKRVFGRPFVKGQSGNPAGRPKKGQTLTDCMRAYLEDTEPEHEMSRKIEFVIATATLARKGDPTALKLMWNYLDGMPVQTTDLNGTLNVRNYEDMSDEELKQKLYAKISKLPKERDN